MIAIDLDVEEWKAFRASVEHDGGALVPCDTAPDLFQIVPVDVSVDGVPLVTIEGQAVHWSDRGEAALTFDDEAKNQIAQAARRLSHRSGSAGSAPDSDAPVWVRYKEMTKPERIKLARSGNQAERRAVLKDRDVSLHTYVLNNPGLTPKELAQLLRGGGVSAGFVRKVTERAELMGNSAVVEALVVNPLTPIDIAVRLVARVPPEVARRIARSSNYRPQVVAAAKKRVTR